MGILQEAQSSALAMELLQACPKPSIYDIVPCIQCNFATAAGWLLCVILTVTGVFSAKPGEVGYYARADSKINTLYTAKWFHVPYPGELCGLTLMVLNCCDDRWIISGDFQFFR